MTRLWLLGLMGCLVHPELRDERLEALAGCGPGFADVDGDGFGDGAAAGCPGDAGWASRDGDCDDGDPGRHPEADERCDGVDQDCDSVVDEDPVDAVTSWDDADGDGWGASGTEVVSCDPIGADRADRGGDCADSDPLRNPGAPERCNGVDDDCDGATDEVGALDGFPVWADTDGDGFGDPGGPDTACALGSGWSGNAFDCDDGAPEVNPNGVDTVLVDGDCDGEAGGVGIADREVFGLAGDFAGAGVAGAGDFDGDGVADWAVGSPGTDGNGYDSGGVWIIPGAAGAGPSVSLASLGWSLTGEYADHQTGSVLRGAGDVNGDGFDDLLVGSVRSNGGLGGAWVVFGSGNPTDGTLSSSPELIGELLGDELGASLGAPGDVDFDGNADLLVGAPGADAVYLLSGGSWAGDWSVNVADAILRGPGGTRTGEAVDGVGDLDGDGAPDLLLGAPAVGAGAVSLVGTAGLSGDLDALTVATRTWLGESSGDRAGAVVAAAGDVDGDGYPDALIGAPERQDGGDRPGGAYLLRGAAAFGPGGLATVSTLLLGADHLDRTGAAVSGAGDVDGDGLADVLIGSPGAAGASGRAALVLGVPLAPAVVDLAVAGLAIGAEGAGDVLGAAVAGVGDTNGDGHDDLVVGAPLHDHGVVETGAAYLILGQPL